MPLLGGGGGVFISAKMMISVLPKELEYEVEKCKYKKTGGQIAAEDHQQIWAAS